MDRLEVEFSETYDKAQEHLDGRKGELSSLATDASENTRQRRIEERVAQKSLEKQALEEQVKREQDIARQREDLEQLRQQYRTRLFDEEEFQDLEELEIKSAETRKIPANNLAESRSTPSLGKDMWNQLKRVSIPIFNGDKRFYEGWTRRPLHLNTNWFNYVNTYLAKHLKSWNLWDTAAAYETAKERLESKFGGKRRQIALHLEELENFKPLRPGN